MCHARQKRSFGHVYVRGPERAGSGRFPNGQLGRPLPEVSLAPASAATRQAPCLDQSMKASGKRSTCDTPGEYPERSKMPASASTSSTRKV